MTDVRVEAQSGVSVRVWIGRLAPIIALVVSGFARVGLDALHASDAVIFSFSFYLALAAGVAWQSLHPRSLVHRFRTWALLIAFLALGGFLPGATVEFTGRSLQETALMFGLPVGVVLTAWWVEERQAQR